MYTGIIHHHGRIQTIEPQAGGGLRLRIDAPGVMDRVGEGSSVNVGGICLTAVDVDANGFSADVMPQTLDVTTIGTWKIGEVVNVEPSMRVGDELGGHFVYGHVDGVAKIVEIEERGNALVVLIEAPAILRRFIVPQGSVSLDGVSLTVADVQGEVFAVSLIPETRERTTWQHRLVGDLINLEVDMMIKYALART